MLQVSIFYIYPSNCSILSPCSFAFPISPFHPAFPFQPNVSCFFISPMFYQRSSHRQLLLATSLQLPFLGFHRCFKLNTYISRLKARIHNERQHAIYCFLSGQGLPQSGQPFPVPLIYLQILFSFQLNKIQLFICVRAYRYKSVPS